MCRINQAAARVQADTASVLPNDAERSLDPTPKVKGKGRVTFIRGEYVWRPPWTHQTPKEEREDVALRVNVSTIPRTEIPSPRIRNRAQAKREELKRYDVSLSNSPTFAPTQPH